ncbi:MAG: ATP-binding protein [Holophaga sp.]
MSPQGPEKAPYTQFAPAGRSGDGDLDAEVAACLENPVAHVILDAVESYALILNEHRQILAANAALFQALAQEDPRCFQGLRPGELLACVHAKEGPDGCGTSRACSRCGAVLAILAAQSQGQPVEGECLLSTQDGGKWDSKEFQVRVTPLRIAEHEFLVMVLRDISAQKRREVLEQVFLHDLMNSLQGLQGWTELLQFSKKDPAIAAQHILDLSDHLSQEVSSHRLLLQAERGELNIMMMELPVSKILEDLEDTLRKHPCAQNRLLEIVPSPQNLLLNSDPRLVHRVLLNMAVNAMEASPVGGSVRIQADVETTGCRFSVRNSGCIPEDVASRIFLRSFSTKAGKGRGLGTYSMKLLGENVLGGEVGFNSTPEEGTRFFMFLPSNES